MERLHLSPGPAGCADRHIQRTRPLTPCSAAPPAPGPPVPARRPALGTARHGGGGFLWPLRLQRGPRPGGSWPSVRKVRGHGRPGVQVAWPAACLRARAPSFRFPRSRSVTWTTRRRQDGPGERPDHPRGRPAAVRSASGRGLSAAHPQPRAGARRRAGPRPERNSPAICPPLPVPWLCPPGPLAVTGPRAAPNRQSP